MATDIIRLSEADAFRCALALSKRTYAFVYVALRCVRPRACLRKIIY